MLVSASIFSSTPSSTEQVSSPLKGQSLHVHLVFSLPKAIWLQLHVSNCPFLIRSIPSTHKHGAKFFILKTSQTSKTTLMIPHPCGTPPYSLDSSRLLQRNYRCCSINPCFTLAPTLILCLSLTTPRWLLSKFLGTSVLIRL